MQYTFHSKVLKYSQDTSKYNGATFSPKATDQCREKTLCF